MAEISSEHQGRIKPRLPPPEPAARRSPPPVFERLKAGRLSCFFHSYGLHKAAMPFRQMPTIADCFQPGKNPAGGGGAMRRALSGRPRAGSGAAGA